MDGKWLALGAVGGLAVLSAKKGSGAKNAPPWPFQPTRRGGEFRWGPGRGIRYDLDAGSRGSHVRGGRRHTVVWYFAPGADAGVRVHRPGPSIRKLGQDVGDFDPRSSVAKWEWAKLAVQHFADHHPEEFRRWASGYERHRLYLEMPKLANHVLGPESPPTWRIGASKKGSSAHKVYSIRHHGPVMVWGDEEWRNPDFQSGDYALWWNSKEFQDAESITEVEGNVVREYTCLAGYVDEPNFEPETPDWSVQEIYLSDDDLHDGKGGVRDSVGWMASIGVELLQERGGTEYEASHHEVMAMDPFPQQALPFAQKKKGSPSLAWVSWSENAPYAPEDVGVRRDFWSAKTSHGTYEWDLDELRYLPAGVTRAGDRSIELWGGKRWRQRRPPKRPGVSISLEEAKRVADEHHRKRRGIRSLRKK
ncbi:hypothetical protein CMI47_00775 [Candidatus Pacearchaeota archaeon]|nr:hypothetical protein [Candidatus Pacearchaeota archaeon]